MDHERAIGGHELANSRGRIGAQDRVERENPVVDHRIDHLAEFNDERGFPRIEKAWHGQRRRWTVIDFWCHAGLNGFRTIPACSNRARTRLAVATA
jgi:hypothetical protein